MVIPLLVPAIALLALAGQATAQPAALSRIEVVLADFSYSPKTIRLEAGQKAVLRLTNQGSGGHNFAAPDFFSRAQLDPASAHLVHKGKVEVKKGASVDLTLTPVAGRYKLKCTHFLHSGFGMKGMIVVE
ncbi:cupredoxin domain-containing protein [Rhizorhapis suberifaciens]|uniref:Plastocyanin n=1 Tax=Rhizorhapis suberifaciens TaxID=13656 RepID=A0A840HXP8_9SPHN|nr:cupredoxin domain-containing protein [Rhizorhapis suberifaciens]MBB4642226.1 plastocyanin [Rhizorhapis suberifaciens]